MRIKPKHPRNAMRERIRERQKDKEYYLHFCPDYNFNRLLYGSISTDEHLPLNTNPNH